MCVQDLRGSVFAYNDEASLSGFHCVKFFLKALSGLDESVLLPFFSGIALGFKHFPLRF